MLKILLRAGARPDLKDEMGRSVWHKACENSKSDIVRFLLKSGYPLDKDPENLKTFTRSVIVGITKPTCLSWAAQKGDSEMVKILLAAGANVNEQQHQEKFSTDDREFGFSALHLAAYYGHREVLKTLLGAKADTKAMTSGRNTAMMLAVQNNQREIMEILKRWERQCEHAKQERYEPKPQT